MVTNPFGACSGFDDHLMKARRYYGLPSPKANTETLPAHSTGTCMQSYAFHMPS